MTTTKTLMLAAFAALSLGVGTAMAQEHEGGGPSYTDIDYWAPSTIAARQAQATGAGQVQAGSSDVTTTRSKAVRDPANWYNLGTVNNPS